MNRKKTTKSPLQKSQEQKVAIKSKESVKPLARKNCITKEEQIFASMIVVTGGKWQKDVNIIL